MPAAVPMRRCCCRRVLGLRSPVALSSMTTRESGPCSTRCMPSIWAWCCCTAAVRVVPRRSPPAGPIIARFPRSSSSPTGLVTARLRRSNATISCWTPCRSALSCSPAPASPTTSPTRPSCSASRCSTSAPAAAHERRLTYPACACPLSELLYPSGSHEHGRMPAGKAAVVHRERACERARLFAKDLFHRPALGEFVDEFVEVADLAHHRLLDLLHADAAYDAGDQKAGRVQLRRVREEILEARLLRKLGFQRGLAVAGEPAEDLIDLGPSAALLLCLDNIGGIDARDGHGIDAAPVGGGLRCCSGCCLLHGG